MSAEQTTGIVLIGVGAALPYGAPRLIARVRAVHGWAGPERRSAVLWRFRLTERPAYLVLCGSRSTLP